MARIDNLTNFLTDVADSIRSKTGKSETIAAEDFDTEIESISGGEDLSEYFTTEITSSNYSGFRNVLVKKVPTITVDTSCTSMASSFYGANFIPALKIICNHTNLTNLNSTFRDMIYVIDIDLSEFNTTNVTNMQNLFTNCRTLSSLNLSGMTTEKVLSMNYMFSDCYKLKSVDVSKFNTSNVTNMSYMFGSTSGATMGLSSLNVSNFNTEKVTGMQGMFNNCTELTSLNVSNFNTEKVTNMQEMFSACKKLTTLDLSNFNTPVLKYTANMFSGCFKLEELDISNFNFSSVTFPNNMFANCGTQTSDGLTKVYVKDTDAQNWILTKSNIGRPSTWSTANVIVAGSSDDLRNQ